MKYCLSSRQTNEYLMKADEIKVQYRDRNIIYDYSQKYPHATFILEIQPSNEQKINWDEINKFKIVTQNKLILCVGNRNDAYEAKTREIAFYFGYPITTFYELNAVKYLGVCYIKVGAPLFFQMDKLKKVEIPIRIVPNIAYDAYLPHPDGVCGQWVRPEDLDIYNDYVTTIEFEGGDLSKERALYRIYAEDKTWKNDLNLLLTNLNVSIPNVLIPPADLFAKYRLTCGQKCQEGRCSICPTTFKLTIEMSKKK